MWGSALLLLHCVMSALYWQLVREPFSRIPSSLATMGGYVTAAGVGLFAAALQTPPPSAEWLLSRSVPRPVFPIQGRVRSGQDPARSAAAPLLNYPPAMWHRF